MVFPNKISGIVDRRALVLEVGPGATPHPRANVFLDLAYDSAEEAMAQRGGAEKADFGGRQIMYYSGGRFPFEDRKFDYVICSHVIEHVDRPEGFVEELFRVSKAAGYIEYPLITYEFIYNFYVHKHVLKFNKSSNTLYYMPKSDLGLDRFRELNSIFFETLEKGWDDLCSPNKNLFFEGFEYSQKFSVKRANDITDLLPSKSLIRPKRQLRRVTVGLMNRLGF